MSKLAKSLDDINEQILEFQDNADKGLAGNKAAAMRSRKASNALTKMFKVYRKLSVAN